MRALISNLFGQVIWNRHRYSLTMQRALFQRLLASLPAPGDVTVDKFSIDGLKAALITPQHCDPQRVIYYLHGGGYLMGSIKSHSAFVAHLAKAAQAKALMIDYRKAPEHPFPAALDDALLGYQWLTSQITAGSHIAIAGDSAGGGLALATLSKLDRSAEPICATCLFSLWVDLSAAVNTDTETGGGLNALARQATRYYARSYVGKESLSHPQVSPLFAELQDMPPVLIQAARDDVLAEDATRMTARLRRQGNSVQFQQYPGSAHCLATLPHRSAKGRKLLEQAATFLSDRFEAGITRQSPQAETGT